MKLLLNKKGFTSITLALMLIMIPAAVLVGMRFYEAMQKGAQLQKSTTTKGQLNSVKNWLMAKAADPDSDGQTELLKEFTGNTLPLAIPIKNNDDWNTLFKYYTWDLAIANGDTNFSQNVAAPPLAGLIGRVISAGKDGIFQTTAASTAAQGDDIMVDITATDVANNKNTSGWTEDVINNKVILANNARNVGIGTNTPGSKLDIAGNANVSSNVTVGGTGTFTGNLSAPNAVTGENDSKTTTITDPNQPLASGFYNLGPGSVNVPVAGTWYHLIHSRHTNTGVNYASQQLINFFNPSEKFSRIINNGVPTAWTPDSGGGGYNGYQIQLPGYAGSFMATGRYAGGLFTGEIKYWDTIQAISGTKWCSTDPYCVWLWAAGDLQGYNNVNGYSYAVGVVNLAVINVIQIW